ncbi:sulfur carrier protein ThiS [Pedobacter foliorum]|jgi:sulfur carrier protein|uniref:sulfur carrier protein ThiS n=1 Tax=Pedobacter foliorum TaxID=2739058 RepID=UPI001563592C|nr:sulfur carrier protein ThiS [Pedobacter foliorum]NRF41861.1 sulfur carrier protein ThiS [Pedobacter foliorum]
MEITVNQQNYEFNNPCSVEQMLSVINVQAKGIAVAINQTIISKSAWAEHELKHGDQVILIKATQGG